MYMYMFIIIFSCCVCGGMVCVFVYVFFLFSLSNFFSCTLWCSIHVIVHVRMYMYNYVMTSLFHQVVGLVGVVRDIDEDHNIVVQYQSGNR